MHDNYVLVQNLSNINKIIKKTFQSQQRIKLTCFTCSQNYLIFGASSGGLYIFHKDPCEFIKLIPSKEGSAAHVSVSLDERYLGIASKRGLIVIVENFIDGDIQCQIFSDHLNCDITYLKWHRNELYVGDNKGKISVVCVTSNLFPTKNIFQVPTAVLMTLDSSIAQIDAFQSFLLISTQTRTYLCNTEKEHFIQIGKKLRDGCFGACFLSSDCATDKPPSSPDLKTTYHTAVDSELAQFNSKIFCARPGGRLWEVNSEAKVLVTYQFKNILHEFDGSELLLIGSEEEDVLQCRTEEVDGNEIFGFSRLFCVSGRFILTYDRCCVYIFDPSCSKLVFYVRFSCDIRSVCLESNSFYVWKDNQEVDAFTVTDLESLIVATLYKKQYYLCIDLCLKYQPQVLELLDTSQKLYLLQILKTKVDELTGLKPILAKVEEMNELVYMRQSKGVVEVNFHSNQEVVNKVEVSEEDKDIKLMVKQYKLNKTHRIIDIPEVTQLLSSSNETHLFALLQRFRTHIDTELQEDASSWCQQQFLKQISQRNVNLTELSEEMLLSLTEGVIAANSHSRGCICGWPLPNSRLSNVKFADVATGLLRFDLCADKILKSAPYLWRDRVEGDLNLLVQYSDPSLFRANLSYDAWHHILESFVKISRNLCLNCDSCIDTSGLMTWTEMAKLTVEYLGAKNALEMLQKYQNLIPKGALDGSFYQTCILSHTSGSNAVKFIDNMDNKSQLKQQMVKFLNKKHLSTEHHCLKYLRGHSGVCGWCKMPLNNDILSETGKLGCGHEFHKFCLDRNGDKCDVCV